MNSELLIHERQLDRFCARQNIKCVILRDGSVTIRPGRSDQRSFVRNRMRGFLANDPSGLKIVTYIAKEHVPRLTAVHGKYKYRNTRMSVGTLFGI